MTAIVKCYATVESKLSQLPVSDGNLIFVRDTGRICLDILGTRQTYVDIRVLSQDTDRTLMLAPVEGFYYVEDTDVLWRYKGGWKQITPDTVDPLFFGDPDDFPPQGKSKTLYISDEGIYRWDDISQTYILTASNTEWKELG